jgi:hypothetical protein
MLVIILKEKTDSQRNLRNFPANQVNDDDELTDENGKALQTF